MTYKCLKCGAVNDIPQDKNLNEVVCNSCKAPLTSRNSESDGSTSAAVGLIGGAALGASIGGPVGAIIGGILGGFIGNEAKGVG
ncbi:MAG: hypothetical protein JRJ44_06395 [Deltaproteobacteria bacterium]|nr:hypothetical protein [Deltaproteobacteria bacterium]